jgi:hypothetical protein
LTRKDAKQKKRYYPHFHSFAMKAYQTAQRTETKLSLCVAVRGDIRPFALRPGDDANARCRWRQGVVKPPQALLKATFAAGNDVACPVPHVGIGSGGLMAQVQHGFEPDRSMASRILPIDRPSRMTQ